jgi:hypothetical protein
MIDIYLLAHTTAIGVDNVPVVGGNVIIAENLMKKSMRKYQRG